MVRWRGGVDGRSRRRGGLGGALEPVIAAVEGSLVDVVVPGGPGDEIRWEDQTSSVSLARQDPNPAYDESDRLWHLRFRADRRGTVVLRLSRQRPGRRPMRTQVTLRIGPG